MGEIIRHSPTDIEMFMYGIGFPVRKEAVAEVFPVFFRNRRVFRIADRVYKVRPHDQAAITEIEVLRHLIPFYQQFNKNLGRLIIKNLDRSSYLIIDMPYIGRSMNDLAIKLDINSYYSVLGSADLTRFTKREIVDLVHRLRQDQLRFSQKHGLIHGDIIQHQTPNNVLYHSGSHRLYLIDAEAYAPAVADATARFMAQTDNLQDWMLSSMV